MGLEPGEHPAVNVFGAGKRSRTDERTILPA
jgi:hypothetical protein